MANKQDDQAEPHALRVTGIKMAPGKSLHDGIAELCGGGWELSIEQVIGRIERGENSFYVENTPGQPRAILKPVKGEAGRFLHSFVGDRPTGHLLALPKYY